MLWSAISEGSLPQLSVKLPRLRSNNRQVASGLEPSAKLPFLLAPGANKLHRAGHLPTSCGPFAVIGGL